MAISSNRRPRRLTRIVGRIALPIMALGAASHAAAEPGATNIIHDARQPALVQREVRSDAQTNKYSSAGMKPPERPPFILRSDEHPYEVTLRGLKPHERLLKLQRQFDIEREKAANLSSANPHSKAAAEYARIMGRVSTEIGKLHDNVTNGKVSASEALAAERNIVTNAYQEVMSGPASPMIKDKTYSSGKPNL